jgi:hypothetical protein
VALKQYDKTIDLLKECFKERGNWMICLKYNKAWHPLRKKKRFQELIRKMEFE